MLRSRADAEAADDGGGQWLTMLVAGLSDAELARIVPELDADEVLGVALRELALRAAPVAGAFATGSLSFVLVDQSDLTWSIAAGATETSPLRAVRGKVAPEAASIHASFATVLQLLAGTLSLDHAVARRLAITTGDAGLLEQIAPLLPETADRREPRVVTPAVEDPTSAA